MNFSKRRAGGPAGCAALIERNHSPWRWPRWKQLGLFASVGRTQRCGRWSRLDESGLSGPGAARKRKLWDVLATFGDYGDDLMLDLARQIVSGDEADADAETVEQVFA